MASESGTTGIEPLYFGGTNPTGSAGGRGPSRTPFPIAEQARRPRSGCVRLGGTKPPRSKASLARVSAYVAGRALGETKPP